MMTSSSPLTPSELQMIAPSHLQSFRHDRYQGEDQRATLKFFAPDDQKLIQKLYQALMVLLNVLRPHHENHSNCRDDLSAFVKTGAYNVLVGGAHELGHATLAEKSNEEGGRLVHDIRGGALQALSFRLQLFAVAPDEAKGLMNIYFLVRDHLKIMRNCVEDLDPYQSARDMVVHAHDVNLLVEKWSHSDFHAVKKPVEVELVCRFDGSICESCLEMSSLDRIIYNLMNNAAKYTSDGVVHFYILPVPDQHAENVRFILVNRISEEHRHVLFQRFRQDLGELFRGGFTTGGSGIGARICADFCAHAYGVFDFSQAKQAGYFGARWIGDYFAAWFHWPMVER